MDAAAITDVTDSDWSRFWSLVNKEAQNGCFLWTGSKGLGVHSYGRFWFRGRNVQAHRFVDLASVGAIADGMQIDHLCRTPCCVNVAHMEVVTPQTNNSRSDSMSALHSRKTHCKRGHPLVGDNLYRSKRGRECRECRRMLERRWYHKHHANEA